MNRTYIGVFSEFSTLDYQDDEYYFING